MNYADLLNAMNMIMFWSTEILKAIGSILLIPIYLLLGASDLSFKEFLRFASMTTHTELTRLKQFGLVFHFSIQHKKPMLKIRSYSEEIEEATTRLNTTSNTSLRDHIDAALRSAKKFSYATFNTYDAGLAFVQCSAHTGMYILDFPLTPLTLNRDYAVQIIKLLNSLGYINYNNLYLSKCYIIVPQSDELTIIQANLGKDRAIATDIITKIHTSILKVSRNPEIVIG